MQSQADQIVLFTVQIINFIVTLLFLSFFSRQLHFLGTYSTTDKYKDLFPCPRVVFSLLYVALSISLIVYNLVEYSYGGVWYDYILRGGGGECINSIVMIIQLFVLRLQLRKERAYTKIHVYYFIYLAIISLVRLVFTLISYTMWPLNVPTLVITVLMLADIIIQLAYWMIKKQTLPRFENPINIGTDILRFPSRQAINRLELTERSGWKTNDDKFPYIFPVVSVELGKFRIILQIPSHGTDLQQQPMSPASSRPNDTTFLSPFLQPSFSIQNNSMPQQVCVSFYTVEQIQQLYINCGRLPLSHKLEFDGVALCDMVRPLQGYLEQLLRQKKWYHPSILQQLKVPTQFISHYQKLIEQMKSDANNNQTQIGAHLLDDKNAIYCSVTCERYLWVSDHYEFYFKTVVQSTGQSGQTHKRFTQFEDHYSSLKQNIKTLNLPIELPPLPKRHHIIHRNYDNNTQQRRTALQGYLKKLTNDCTIMTVPLLRQSILQFLALESDLSIEGRFQTEYYYGLQLCKGEITKKIVNNDCVTYYQFGLFKNGIQIKSICKRFSEIEQLHRELERWMNNIQITYQIIVLPERVYYKSEALRHEKMMLYLQNVVAIRDIGMVYAVNRFFNIRGEQTDSESQISAIAKKRRKGSYATPIIEMSPLQRRLSNESSGRFSKQMNDLGNQDLD